MTKTKEKIEYKIRSMRLSDKVWEDFKNKRYKSKLGWNKFIKSINTYK